MKKQNKHDTTSKIEERKKISSICFIKIRGGFMLESKKI